jgi:lamin tail-like protein
VRTLVIASFVLFFLSVTIPFTSLTAPQPTCADLTPPNVPGPLSDPPSSPGNLFINEVLLTPNRTWVCPSDQPPPDIPLNAWVEIYNSQNVSIDLYKFQAALESDTDTYYFPMGSAIAAHSFLVVFPRTSGASFSQVSQLRLLISGNVVLDTIDLPLSMPPNTSYARVTDGGNQWQWLTTPTPGTSNPAALQTAITSTTATTTLTRTPTPKASPTPRHTPTPHTSKSSRSGVGGLQDGSTGDNGQADQGSDSSVLVDGVQPAWNKLPVPGSPTSSPTAATNTSDVAANEPLTASDNSGDHTIRNIEMTVVAILLAGSLFWCWKLFVAPVLAKQKR